jgi:molybdate transport system substrate-binding protein
MKKVFFLLSLWIIFTSSVSAVEIKIAVASNFTPILKKIAKLYEAKTKNSVKLTSGSSGKLYSMITNGAPFDIFLSADTVKTSRLISTGKALEASRFVYARGSLVAWSNKTEAIGIEGLVEEAKSIAIANPKHAPYGIAAKQFLRAKKIYKKKNIVVAENASQAYSFVNTKNVDIGFVPLSLLLQSKINPKEYWIIPKSFYSPIKQEMVIIAKSQKLKVCQQFLSFIQESKIQKLIEMSGYNK